jgi:multicomponent Na+:H+ antiporter subunit B
MNSLILRTATRLLLPLLLLLSLFLLYRGHNEPGGGFVGGLLAAAALALYAVAVDVQAARRMVRVAPQSLIGAGLLVAAASGAAPLLMREPFLKGLWTDFRAAGLAGAHFGSPMLFDVGVYLVVVGVTLTVIFALLEE